MFNLIGKTTFRDFEILFEFGVFQKKGNVKENFLHWMTEMYLIKNFIKKRVLKQIVLF